MNRCRHKPEINSISRSLNLGYMIFQRFPLWGLRYLQRSRFQFLQSTCKVSIRKANECVDTVY